MDNKKSLNYLFSANAISGFAQGISMLAIPWYFNSLQLSTYFNLSYGVITIVIIFWGLYAGTLVDRYNRKKVFLYLNLICGLLFGIISIVGMAGWITSEAIHHLLIVSVFAITMFNYNIHYPALYALGQEITDASSYGKFNSRIEIVGQSVSILSGGIAAFMLEGLAYGQKIDVYFATYILPFEIKPWSIDFIIFINAVSHILAVLFIYPIKYTFSLKPKAKETLHERLKLGFDYLKEHPYILVFGLASYSVFAMLLVEIHAVLPGYIERHLHMGGAVFAVADAVYAVGALAAGLLVRKVFRASGVKSAVILLTVITAFFFICNTFTVSVMLTMLMSLVLGFTNAGIRVLRLTWLFEHVPNEVMGRVNSIFNMANLVFRFLFIFLFSIPVFHQANNIRWAYFVMAVFLILSALVLIKRKNPKLL
jgi:DHA3 family macrolide efflux protein-like MFS transporter